MARGGELIIDEKFVKHLIDADKAIRNISDSASNAERSMMSWMSKLNSGSLTDFVRGLEETKNKYDLMIGALSKQEGFGKFTQNCKDAADEVQKLINVISQTPQFKLDLYDQQTVQRTKEIEQNARTIQETQLRDNAIAEQKKAHVQEELNRYKLLKKEIEELEKIRREAKEVKTTSTDTELVKDAKKTYAEANRQLKAYKEEQKRLESKYAVEIELMNKDAAMRSFSSRVKAAKDANKAVEEEIEKEKKARLQALEQESREHQRYTERIKELERQKKSVDGDAKKAVEAEIKREKDAYLKSLDAQIKARQEYNARMEALAREQAKRNSNRRRENFNNLAITDPNKFASNALNYTNRIYSDKGVLSINNMQKALSRMRDAQQNLNLKTGEGRKKYDELGQQIKRVEKDLKNATKGVGGFKSESDKLGRVFSQLKTQLTALFGVAAIKGYIQKLVDVRREFERQQTALEGILQSKDEADKLWSQTTQLALESPFSVRELITYTKQLSAYRIETDKLHDTTKRLADVSAGLGVDMSRLILAYGQVRAAEYLRGTELRQFTEAGIPMLDELARYFTELEGRAISTADVFNMISKRMVEFEDVEAVIHRMTDEGGIFFEMQEQQSKTLHGELSNLKDAYELMLNSIGENNEGTIKSAISDLRELIKNWRVVVSTIEALKPILYTFGSVFLLAQVASTKFAHRLVALGNNYKVLLGWNKAWNRWLITTTRNSKAAGLGIRLLGGAIRGLAATGVMAAIGLLITGIVKLAYNIAQAGARAKELREAFSSIDVEISGELDKGIESYKELVAQIKDVTLSYGEREKAMQRLKRQFQDILPDQYLELEYIEKTTDAYSEATDALRNYYNAKSREQKEGKLNDIFGEDILKEASNLQNKYANTFATRLGISSKSVREVLDKTIEEVKKGTIKADELYGEFLERLQTYSGKTISDVDYKTFYKGNERILKGLIDVLKDYEGYRGDISGLSFETKKEEEAYKQREQAKKQLETETKKIEDLKKAYEEYYKAKKKGASQDELRQLREDAYTIYKQLNVRDLPVYKEFQQISNSMFDIEKEIAIVAAKAYDKFIAKESKKENPLIKQLTEEATKAKSAYNASDIRKASEEIARVASNQFGVDLKIFDKIRVSQDDTLTNALTNAKAEIDARKSVITAYDNSVESLKKLNLTEAERASTLEKTHGYTKAEMELYKKETEAITSYYNALGGDNELSKQTKKSSKETLNSQISLIKEMHEKYKDLHEEFSSITAEQKVMNSYAEAFSEIFENTPISLITREIKKGLLDTLTGTAQISQQVRDEIDKLIEAGTHIRNHTEDFVDEIKRREDFTPVAKDIGDGKWTYGYGDTIGVKKGDTITKEEADMKLRKRLTDTFVAGLNEVLDKNKELILTQQQYNALLDLTYQGGKGAVKRLIEYAKNSEKAIEHVTSIQSKVSSVFGKEAAERFGETFIQKLKDSEDIYERIALLLQTMNLTVKGGQISPVLYKGMQKRSDERAGIFSGTLEISKAIRKASIETSNINIKTVEGVVQTLKGLLPYAKKFGDDVYKELLKAIAGYEAEIELEAKIKEREDIATQLDALFQGYELSLDLKELKLPTEYLKDIFKIDATNLDELQSKVNEYIAKLKEGVSEVMQDENSTKEQVEDARKRVELAEETEKKINKIIDDEQLRRAKKYTQYLLKSQSEAVKIKLEELRQLEEIESLSDVSNAHKKAMRQGVRDEAQKKLDKATWDSFKDSDMYIRLFEDLESQSTRSLNRMREELKKYRNSLKELDDPTALKEISERIESLDEQIAKRNPFKGLSESYKKFRETRKQFRGEKELELLLDKNRQEESLLQSKVDAKHLKINEAELRLNEALKSGDTFRIALAESLLRVEENELETLLAKLVAQKKITQEQADALREQQEAEKNFEDSLSGLGNKIAAYTSALPEIMNDLEAMGVSVDESLKDAAESAAEIGEGVNSIMQGFASDNPLAVIQGITKTGAAISRIFDKSEERRIQRRIEKIEDLSRAYEKLQKRIENAYSIGELRSSYDESFQNIDKQIQAYEDMIAAEEDKKKTDKERIKEWKQAQEDLEQQKKELQDQQLQELGGFGESGVKEAAQQFVDAWMDAFQETGDGLSGLEGKWDEYIKNVIRKQMALKVSDHFIKNITDEVDKALKDDSNLSAEELAKINQMADEALPALSEALQKIANEYGGSALSSSVGELSGLTQGIQGITEQTADQLAGLVNSIRLLVADNYKELVNIANALGSSTQVENPMVSQLKIIASHTNNINSLLESVVTSSTSGRGIRVITQV